MRQYFCYVNPYMNGAWQPVELNVKKNTGVLYDLIGKNFCVAHGSAMRDPRILGYIDIPGDENNEYEAPAHPGHKYAVQSGIDLILKMFPHDLQSAEQAKDKIERWTGRTNITIEGDQVIIPGALGDTFLESGSVVVSWSTRMSGDVLLSGRIVLSGGTVVGDTTLLSGTTLSGE